MRTQHEIDIVQNPRWSTRYDRRPAGTDLDRRLRTSVDAFARESNLAHVAAGPRLVRSAESR